ncbi:hypothetical protein [Solidesulfovibrio sp. C21]|uniref:hypothetical protein n=1 Tax=Solidesulfovibrio sp. C21 TaxID=3398613 RepID=UPI0039FCCEED
MNAIPTSIAPEHTAVLARLTEQDRTDIEKFKRLAPAEMRNALQMAVVACYLHMGRSREQAV